MLREGWAEAYAKSREEAGMRLFPERSTGRGRGGRCCATCGQSPTLRDTSSFAGAHVLCFHLRQVPRPDVAPMRGLCSERAAESARLDDAMDEVRESALADLIAYYLY